jgi:chloramphenicol-sensitive protein RarD
LTWQSYRQGFLYGVVAYGVWGLVPLYFHQVREVDPRELLAHRLFWSFLILLVVLSVFGRWPEIRKAGRNKRTLGLLLLSALFLIANWYAYIVSVFTHRILEASLGYFMLPLVNVLFGMVIYREKLRPLQGIALAIAACGIGRMIYTYGEVPWLSLFLALTFGMYGVVRKSTPVDGLTGFSWETFLLVPFAAVYLLKRQLDGDLRFMHPPSGLDGWIIFSGIVTTIPLICFAQAVRRIGLINISFIQYFSPTIQLLIAVFFLGEEFSESKRVSFIFVWVGLVIFIFDTFRLLRAARDIDRQQKKALIAEPLSEG